MTSQPLPALQGIFAQCIAMDAPLRDQLAAFADAVRQLQPAFIPPVEALIARLRSSAAGAAAPQVGETMPDFSLPDETGALVGLDALRARGPVVVVFHRGHWCPYCRISSTAMARAQPEIAAAGGGVVAILPDRQAYAARLKAQAGARYPFLSDIDNGYALSINLVFWIGQELRQLYSANGNPISDWQGNDAWFLPIPATFVVRSDGEVAARYVDPDYRRRMATEDVIAAVSAAR